MQRMYSISSIAAAVALACAAPFALAQTTSAPQHPQSGAITHTPPFQSTSTQNPAAQPPAALPPRIPQPSTSAPQGVHDMTGTVTSVSSDDFVELKTDDGALKLHFPGAHSQLKQGDKITVHLGYNVDADTSPGSSASP